MKNYSCSVEISAPATSVYDALTTPQGLKSWWTKNCDVATSVGGQSTFRFDQTYNVMRLESLRPGAEVWWQCVEQYHHAPGQIRRTDEWAGTSVIFQLEAKTPDHTLLKYEHVGLQPELECYEICERGWNHFLKRSLKNFVETSKGEPY